jgi:phosphate transport system substrate-binding protein
MTALLSLMAVTSCSGSSRESERAIASASTNATTATLSGAGATFPYPLYMRWFARFAADGGSRVNYQSIGSGAGVRALVDRRVDFAATDVPLDAGERTLLAAQQVRQVPLAVGGAAVGYNVPGMLRQLRLDGPTLAGIFLGRITHWNDAQVVALNPDVQLPDAPIAVVTRSDTSGTSWILTDFLARQSADWARGPGRSKHPVWPVGKGVRGNEVVASQLKATEYSIGVVEAVYAMQNHLAVARIRNHAGAWVTPQTGALRAAASAMLTSIDDTVEFATSITDAPGELSYPIASLSWLIVPTAGRDAAHLAGVRQFVLWALTNGEPDALALGYAPLPDAMRGTLMRAWSRGVQAPRF